MSELVEFKKEKPFKMDEFTFYNWVKKHREDMVRLLEELTYDFSDDCKETIQERLDSIVDNADYYDSLFNFSPNHLAKYMEMNNYED